MIEIRGFLFKDFNELNKVIIKREDRRLKVTYKAYN